MIIMDPHSRTPKKNQAMEMRCYRKILHISYKDHVTNEEVCAKIQQAIGPHEGFLIVKRCKLHWYGHVTLSLGLAKTTLHGTVKGGRGQGRQKKRWEDKSRNRQAWSSPSSRGQWRTGENGWEIICGATTLAVKGQMMMMIMTSRPLTSQ